MSFASLASLSLAQTRATETRPSRKTPKLLSGTEPAKARGRVWATTAASSRLGVVRCSSRLRCAAANPRRWYLRTHGTCRASERQCEDPERTGKPRKPVPAPMG